MIAIALIITGIILISFFVFEILHYPTNWLANQLHGTHQYFMLFSGIGFLIIGIKILQKKKD